MKRQMNIMYLRKSSLQKEFILRRKESSSVSGRGRAKKEVSEQTEIIKGILSEAKSEDIQKAAQNDKQVTHTIVQIGTGNCCTGDLLIYEKDMYEVKSVDPCGYLNVSTIYYVEKRTERNDGKNES